MRRIVYLMLVTFVTSVLLPKFSISQETTATLTGTISDAAGAPITGASIVITHVPTGFVTKLQTNNKGRFAAPTLKAGGPYTIKISYVGLKDEVLNDINLALGDNPDLNVSLSATANELKEVTVLAAGRKAAPSGLTVSTKQLNTLPTLGRSLSDFTRLTPQSNNNSFAGTNFRYNNITLDGAINNDAIGFSNSFGGVSGGGQSGTAGSGTRTNPYSLDVIQEVQVQLTPYDVKLGNFTGGSVNAVTKSGTNDFHGSIYGYGRNQAFVGKSVDGTKSKIGSDFYDYQYGGTLSGPIIKNKLFFIVNGEITRRQEPTFFNAGDPGSISIADAQRVVAAYKKAGYDPGSYDQYKIFTNSNKFFGRIDYNIDPNNTLMLRAIYTEGEGNNLERTNTTFQFSSTDFTQHTKNLNLVAELKTKFSNSVNNNLIVSYINVHDYRDFPTAGNTPSPYVDITNGAINIWAGTWREAAIYNTRQKTFEITDNVTWTKGINKFTFGTHNEFYDFNYGFINSWNGRWQYGTLDNFENNLPSRIRGAFAFDKGKNNYSDLSNNTPGAKFNVAMLSAYAQDEIAVTKRFKITPGIRVDYSSVGSQPPMDKDLNSITADVHNSGTFSNTPYSQLSNKWLGNAVFSPRLGFNWDINGDQSTVLRGGTGIFTGRVPFAWLGYAYTLNGNDYGNVDYKANNTYVPLVGPNQLVDTIGKYGGAGAVNKRELDLIDNNFKMPTIWRSNVAVDFKFGHGYKLTLDAMYTKTLYDVMFQQINKKDSGVMYYATGPTQTPLYTGGDVSSKYSSVFLLSNTKEGYRYNFTVQLTKATNNIRLGATHSLNFNWSAAYTYGMSKDVSNGIRNSFQSNWDYNPAISANSPALGYSNFDLRHRIVAFAGANFIWSKSNASSISFVYSGQSGSPYSLVYTGAPGGIINGNAALPYIPKDQNDIILKDPTQWAALNSFIEGDSYLKNHRGQYADRNGLRTPWNHTLDMKLMHEFKFNNKHSLTLSLDVFNVLNLINNDWGHITFVTNTNNYTVNFLKFEKDAKGVAPGNPTSNPATNYTPTFSFQQPTTSNGKYYTVDPINSRWQGQFGIKYTF
ncbi:MAG: TonB-dependent receptor [Filimonas sp.]|nr:TonB-dependent receptor [Filimonas sp.]